MAAVYIVTGLDYRAKENENIDERDLTQYICRVFSKADDAEKYIMDFFNNVATNYAHVDISRNKKGFIMAELKDKYTEKGIVYNSIFRVTTEVITDELGENNLYEDEHKPYCD